MGSNPTDSVSVVPTGSVPSVFVTAAIPTVRRVPTGSVPSVFCPLGVLGSVPSVLKDLLVSEC